MISQPKIAILLSTYNGAKFLAEQLDSLLQQSYSNLVIVIRDDGSTDTTVELISHYCAEHKNRIHWISNDEENLGASGSFSFLIEYVLANKEKLELDSAYMMFCDQDDIWFEDKIEKQVAAMLQAEQNTDGKTMPLLVHTDLQVVSEQNQAIAKSLIRYQGLEIERNRFTNMVISNLVTGCTALINEALAVKAVPVSKQAIMHDWWLALVAAAFGKVIFLNTPLVHYRQHDSNTIGAKEFVKPTPISRSFWQRVFGRKPNDHLTEVARQALEFRQRFGAQLSFRENMCLRLSAGMSVQTGIIQRVFYRLARRL
jgi:glycosyltransferase involved in cell wall biosynthesis